MFDGRLDAIDVQKEGLTLRRRRVERRRLRSLAKLRSRWTERYNFRQGTVPLTIKVLTVGCNDLWAGKYYCIAIHTGNYGEENNNLDIYA
jgi:hypothetical protein